MLVAKMTMKRVQICFLVKKPSGEASLAIASKESEGLLPTRPFLRTKPKPPSYDGNPL